MATTPPPETTPTAAKPTRKRRRKRSRKKGTGPDLFTALDRELAQLDLTDPIAMNKRLHAIVIQTAFLVASKTELTTAEVRRVQLVSNLARVAAQLTPQSAIAAAVEMITGDGERLARGSGPQMEPVSDDGTTNTAIGTGTGGAKARRGGPRKRPLG